MKRLFEFLFKLTGWEVVGSVPNYPKLVMLAAPHTSNWDFLYARGAFFIMGLKVKFTIKKELFFFPLGPVLKLLGGIPIDRKNKNGGMVQSMIEQFHQREELVILVTPEGTRSYNPNWKKGFYYIALGANVPMVLGYLDYEKKHAGIGPIIHPSGDVEKDIEKMKEFYRTISAKYPSKGVK